VKNNSTHLAYLAGIFDGEGTLDVHESFYKGKKYRSYPQDRLPSMSVNLTIPNTSMPLLSWIVANFGGKIYVGRHLDKFPKRKPCHKWRIGSREGQNLVEKLLPFLIIKKRDAELYIKIRETVGHRKRLPEQTGSGGGMLPDNIRKKREILLSKWRNRNK